MRSLSRSSQFSNLEGNQDDEGLPWVLLLITIAVCFSLNSHPSSIELSSKPFLSLTYSRAIYNLCMFFLLYWNISWMFRRHISYPLRTSSSGRKDIKGKYFAICVDDALTCFPFMSSWFTHLIPPVVPESCVFVCFSSRGRYSCFLLFVSLYDEQDKFWWRGKFCSFSQFSLRDKKETFPSTEREWTTLWVHHMSTWCTPCLGFLQNRMPH